MIFNFKMAMKGKNGAPISFMQGEVKGIDSVEKLCDLLNDDRFIIIEQFKEERDGSMTSIGQIVVRTRSIHTIRRFKVRFQDGVEEVGGED